MADKKNRIRICIEVSEQEKAMIDSQIAFLQKQRTGTKVTVSDAVRYAIANQQKRNENEG